MALWLASSAAVIVVGRLVCEGWVRYRRTGGRRGAQDGDPIGASA
jgi:hypothetical protein